MNKYLNLFSAVSVLGIIAWVATDFCGGMVIHLFAYWWIIIPLNITYAITLVLTISKVIQYGFANSWFTACLHLFGLATLTAFSLYTSELFKSEIILRAILIDDLSSITIELRADKRFNTTVNGMLGFVERISGEYHLSQDTVVFHQPPYSSDFIPNKMLIVKPDSAIYFNKLESGEYSRAKDFAGYFKIQKSKL